MAFQLSRCVGICASDPQESAGFYMEVFKMKPTTDDSVAVLGGSGLRFFIDPSDPRPVLFELSCKKLEEGRNFAKQFGFQEITWSGVDQLNMVVDPFGNRWNIHEDKEGPEFDINEIDDDCPILPKIGIISHLAPKVAEYYASVLDEPAVFANDSWIIDSGPMRLRIQTGLPEGPTLWVENDFNLDLISESAKKSYAIDSNGVTWRRMAGQNSSKAVIEIEKKKKS